MKCKNCEKEAVKYSKYTSGEFCSLECSRSFSTKNNEERKNKISNTLKGTGHGDVTKICKNCEKEFTVIWRRRKQECCSKSCGSQYSNNVIERKEKMSKIRTDAIKNGIINGNGKKSEYVFNDEIIKCDSKIENSCINYFENLGAESIKRSSLVIDYHDGDTKRKFLPDFEILLNDKKYIVEAKGYISMKTLDEKWREYNRISILKKEVLEIYCKEKGYEFFWFTQKYNRKYYNNLK